MSAAPFVYIGNRHNDTLEKCHEALKARDTAIAALTAERDKYRTLAGQGVQIEHKLRGDLLKAEAALAERDKDAERYRWLRARWDAATDEDLEQHTDAMNADDPDAAIDAAIREKL